MTPVGAVKGATKLGLKGVAKTLDKISNPIGRSTFGAKELKKRGEQLYNFSNKYADIRPELITKKPKTWVDDGAGNLVPIYDDIPMFKEVEARNPHLRSVSLEKQLTNVKDHTAKQGEMLNIMEKAAEEAGYKIDMGKVAEDAHSKIQSKLQGAAGGRADAALMEEATNIDDIVKGIGRTRTAKHPRTSPDIPYTRELDLAQEALTDSRRNLIKAHKKFGKFRDNTPANEIYDDIMDPDVYPTLPPALKKQVHAQQKLGQKVEHLQNIEKDRQIFTEILDADAGKNFDLDDSSIKQLAEKYQGAGIKDHRKFLNAEMETGLGKVGVSSANWLRRTVNVDNFTKQYVEQRGDLNKSNFAKATGMKLSHFAEALKKNNDMLLDQMAREMPEVAYQKMMARARKLADPEQLKMIDNRQLSTFWNDVNKTWLLGKRKGAVLGDALSGGGKSEALTYAVGAGLAGVHHPVMQVRAAVGIPGYIGRFMAQGMLKYGDKTTKFLNKASYQYFQEIARREPEFEFYAEQLENLENEE